MIERVYLTLSGRAEWATFNSLWAVLRYRWYVPTRIVILTFPEDKAHAETSSTRKAALLEVYGSPCPAPHKMPRRGREGKIHEPSG